MKTIVLPGSEEVAEAVAAQIEEQLRQKPDSLICLCGGDSPVPVFRRLVEDARRGLYPADRLRFVGLDEWVGLGLEDEGSCYHGISERFLRPLGIDAGERIFFFDALSADLQGECRKAEEFISRGGGIDFMLLGIGMNGHIGFNEPGCSARDGVRVVELSETSKSVGQKYFSSARSLELGITLGVRQMLEAKKARVIALGAHKAEVVREAVQGKVDSACPATLLREHRDCELYLDSAAASKL